MSIHRIPNEILDMIAQDLNYHDLMALGFADKIAHNRVDYKFYHQAVQQGVSILSWTVTKQYYKLEHFEAARKYLASGGGGCLLRESRSPMSKLPSPSSELVYSLHSLPQFVKYKLDVMTCLKTSHEFCDRHFQSEVAWCLQYLYCHPNLSYSRVRWTKLIVVNAVQKVLATIPWTALHSMMLCTFATTLRCKGYGVGEDSAQCRRRPELDTCASPGHR
jgi:hypothetical protein